MIQTAKRLDHIDIAKAIGLLLVIYGHTFRMSMRAVHPWCAFSYTFVYRFHVPLLYFLSGMGCTLTAQKNRSLSARQFLHKKVHRCCCHGAYTQPFCTCCFIWQTGCRRCGRC